MSLILFVFRGDPVIYLYKRLYVYVFLGPYQLPVKIFIFSLNKDQEVGPQYNNFFKISFINVGHLVSLISLYFSNAQHLK